MPATQASEADGLIVTPRGFERLEQELHELRTVKRRDLARRLHEAVDDGELDENAAYESLKTEQAFLEGRIAELEDLLGRARVVEPCEDSEVVMIGSSVELQSPEGALDRFTVVGAAEADPRQGLISYASPLGRALLNRACGEELSYQAPDGLMRYRILSIIPAGKFKSPRET